MKQGRAIAATSRRKGSEHLQVIAVANFKGGSGKTTTTAHLSQYLALQGYNVLCIDLDPSEPVGSPRLPARVRRQRQRDDLQRDPLRRAAHGR